MVRTFELGGVTLSEIGSHATLSEAAATLPQGSYTTLRTYGSDRVLRLDQHVRRLEESLPGAAPLAVENVRAALADALERTAYRESRLRLTYASPRLFLSVEPFEPLPESRYSRGARCVTLALERQDPQAKRTGFIATAASAYAKLPAGVDEALMVAADGSILEGLSSNFFAVRGDRLRTEEARVLPGVTRAIVLELAEALLATERTALRVAELDDASECFITSVSREILPVVAIDGKDVGDGRPGPRTRELMRRFAELVAKQARPLRGSG